MARPASRIAWFVLACALLAACGAPPPEEPLDMTISEGHATVRFTAALTGGSGGWIPDSGSLYRVETGWRRDGDAWRLTSARWERDL